ncbi:MAG: alpha-1,2-fucosyltransferase [Clostridiales bacterium]|nr:alpha-1,2-fucosyltransferase [Clostridiales bacterium]
MNIVWIDGGLGNQMFQYALALKLQSLGKEVKIDVTKYAEHHSHNDFELDKVFRISCPFAGEDEIRRLGYRKANHWTEFLKKTPFGKKSIYNNESYQFDESVFLMDERYLEGYWQSEKYFMSIRDKILETYQFPEFASKQQKEWAARMQSGYSISVHIRRGDYLNYSYLQNICTLDYYKRAMQYFRDRYQGGVEFYIFTNDFPWAEEHFLEKDCHFVKGNTGTESFRDMQLMSLCKHNIIANSSFSWWGAWLNQNADKIVIAPEKWVNRESDEKIDIIPDTWMKVKG